MMMLTIVQNLKFQVKTKKVKQMKNDNMSEENKNLLWKSKIASNDSKIKTRKRKRKNLKVDSEKRMYHWKYTMGKFYSLRYKMQNIQDRSNM